MIQLQPKNLHQNHCLHHWYLKTNSLSFSLSASLLPDKKSKQHVLTQRPFKQFNWKQCQCQCQVWNNNQLCSGISMISKVKYIYCTPSLGVSVIPAIFLPLNAKTTLLILCICFALSLAVTRCLSQNNQRWSRMAHWRPPKIRVDKGKRSLKWRRAS